MKLSNSEIDFLLSLSASTLHAVLREMSQKDRQATLKQLRESLASSKKKSTKRSSQKTQRDYSSEYRREKYQSLQDIAPLPFELGGAEAEIRYRCDRSLRVHLETCYPAAFTLAWSEDHELLMSDIESAVRDGQLKARALPRGSGKTTLIVRAALWAMLSGLRRFLVLLAATQDDARKLLKGIKQEIAHNPMLAKLYPRELHALRSLGGEARRASGQKFEGIPTQVQWGQDELCFGYLPDVQTSGGVITACGITGSVRGQQSTGADGEIIRPDILLGDDLQTKESAASPTQCHYRHEIMMGDALGMAGPGVPIAGLVSGTVIYRGDLMDRLLDHRLSPQWSGVRCSLVYKWPDETELWERYRTILDGESLGTHQPGEATAFVLEHYDRMHRGSIVEWPERKAPDEASALEHAFKLLFRDEATFWAEYMNQPIVASVEKPYHLEPEILETRTYHLPRNIIPLGAKKLTAFIDVQKDVLFYSVVAWELGGRGYVIDYGSYPDQRRLHFTKASIGRTLMEVTGADSVLDGIYIGLDHLVTRMFDKEYPIEDAGRGDALMGLDRVGIDARWGFSTKTIRRFCRETPQRGRVHPMLGQYIGANSRPWHRWTHQKTDLIGIHCKLQAPPKGQIGVRELLVDTNWWKSFTAEKLMVHRGSEKAITFHKAAPHEHRMWCQHLTAEEPVMCHGKQGNQVVEWQKNNSRDEDFWDTLVGNCVLSSIEKVKVETGESRQQKAKKKRTQKGPRRKHATKLKW